jgi:hypothetical protein
LDDNVDSSGDGLLGLGDGFGFRFDGAKVGDGEVAGLLKELNVGAFVFEAALGEDCGVGRCERRWGSFAVSVGKIGLGEV